jgi:hypothetical protein
MPQDPPSFTSAPYDPADNPLAGLTFTVDGSMFECKGEVEVIDLSELAMMSGMDAESPEALGVIAAFMQVVLGPIEYMRFKSHTRIHHTDIGTHVAIMTMISDRIKVLVEGLTGRPTMPQSSSSDGPAGRDERISRVISLARGDVTVVGEGDPLPPSVPADVAARTGQKRSAARRRTATGG